MSFPQQGQIGGLILATPTVSRERIAPVACTHRWRIEDIVALDARPPWSAKLNRTVPTIFVAEDPINLNIFSDPIKVKPKTAILGHQKCPLLSSQAAWSRILTSESRRLLISMRATAPESVVGMQFLSTFRLICRSKSTIRAYSDASMIVPVGSYLSIYAIDCREIMWFL